MDSGLKKIAAFLGIIQGLGWVVMTIICISFYFAGIQDISPQHFIESIGYLMYYFYLDSSNTIWIPPLDHPLTSGVFTGFMWVYLVLSLIWLIASILILTTKKQTSQEKALKAWAHCTLTISLWDIITVVILGVDYDKCMNLEINDPGLMEGVCANVVLPVLIIAAKGFVLWIVNVSFAIVLIKMVKRLKQAPAIHHIQQQRAPFQLSHAEYPYNVYGEHPQGHPLQNLQRDSYHHQYSPTHSTQYNRNMSKDEYGQPHSPSAYHTPSAPQTNKNQIEYPVPIPAPDYYQQQPSPPRRHYF